MPPSDFTVFLKIRHPSIDPALLTEAFGIVPECSWKAGESKAGGSDATATRRESYWVAQVPALRPEMSPEFVSLESTLMLTALLLERRKDFWAKLRAEGASAQLIVVLGGSALSRFELPHDLLSMLSKCGLSVSVDLRDAAEAAA